MLESPITFRLFNKVGTLQTHKWIYIHIYGFMYVGSYAYIFTLVYAPDLYEHN